MADAKNVRGSRPASASWRVARVNLLIFTISLSVSAILSLVLAVRDSGPWWAVCATLGALVAFAWFAVPRRGNPRAVVAGLLALAVINLVVLVPELGLRLTDFSYVSGVQFGFPTPEEFWHLEPDEELLWRFSVDDPQVNSLGFVGDEPIVPKPADTFRLLFLGDSCTFQGKEFAYPRLVERALTQRSSRRVDVVILAAPGYTSHQGRVLAERYGALLEPDLVFVYFGWNDHWLAYGAIDAEKSVAMRAERVYRSSRLLQAIRRIRVDSGFVSPARPLDVTRVPLHQYRQNLERILAVFRSRGVTVVFVTAPSAHSRYGVPDFLLQLGLTTDAPTVMRLHREYNEVVREVAREPGAVLLDAEIGFDQLEESREMFTADGIHFTATGHRAMAQVIVASLLGDELVQD